MGNSLGLCSKCWEPLDGAHASYCKKCHAAYQRERRLRDPEYNAKAQAWNRKNRERRLSYKRLDYLRRYGFSKSEALALMARTDLTCEICQRPVTFGRGGDKLAIDHNHDSGRFRGLLCQDCNIMLGKARESELILRRAVTYLRRSIRKAG